MTEQPNAKISQEPATKNILMDSDGANIMLPSEAPISTEEKSKLVGKSSEITLLDEGSLLRCIVRTIPPNGRIRISSTVSETHSKIFSG